MSSRVLMATVAAIALTAPAVAQDQTDPLQTQQEQAVEPAQTEQAPMAAPQEPAQEGLAQEEPAAPPPDMSFIDVQDDAQFLAKDEVIGKSVVNIADEEVGTIADLVMDQEQKLVGVVLSVGGFLGIGEKWVAIPVDQIEFPTADQPARLQVAVTEEQLKNAPDFMTRQEVEAEREAAQAQQQATQQQAPPPTTGMQ